MVITRREKLVAFAFVAPAVLVISAFVIWPTLHMLLTSLQRPAWGQSGLGSFSGASNYADLLADPAFRQSLRNTAVFTVLVVPLQTALALLLAVWANGAGWTMRVLRLSVFIPTTVSLAVLSVVWKLMCEPSSATGAGLFNGLLGIANLPPQPFLTSPQQALPAIVAMSVWQGMGLQMMVFLAGLQQVPQQLYEAAQLDGAGQWGRFRHVTLPQLAATSTFVATITMIFALKLFVQPFLMTSGGPEGTTRSVVQYVYETAFFGRDLGLACAAGSLFLAAVLALTLGARALSRRAEELA